MKKLILFLLIVCTTFNLYAELELDGFLDIEKSIRLEDDYDYLISKNRARFNIKDDYDNYSVFLSLNAVTNNISETEEIELHEVYIDYYGEIWELRVGRQINTWGKADGIRITDVINPVDYSEFIIRDFDDLRIPTDMVRVRRLGDISDLEIIWIPEFKSNIAPSGKWKTSSSTAEITTPEKNLENSEIGARSSFYLSSLDFSIAAFYTWNDLPVMKISNDNLTGEFKRDKFIGADIAKPVGSFVIRAETAYHPDRYFSRKNYSGDYIQKDLAKLLLGLDWNPGNSLMITGQLAGELVVDYDKDTSQDEFTPMFTLNISKKYMNDTLEFANFTYLELDKDSMYNKFEVIRNFTDTFELTGAIDLFAGSEGTFGVYEDNSQLRVKAKYSF